MLVNLILRRLRGLNLILQTIFSPTEPAPPLSKVNKMFPLLFSLPDPLQVMWSVAATSKVNLIGGGEVREFQFAIQNTRQIRADDWPCLGNFSARVMKLFQCQYTSLLAKYIRLISHSCPELPVCLAGWRL